MKKKQTTHINLFEYTDYRKFLQDYYKVKKQETPYFSYRYFSKIAGFTSPNYLKLIMDGERNLSPEGINKFTKALKLKPKEARYFRILILMNQAATHEEREFYTRQVLKSKGYKAVKPLNKAQYDYYSQWFHIPLRELVVRSDFNSDPSWIAHQFTPPLKETEVKEGIETLLKLGLIEKTKDDSFIQKDSSITTGDRVTGQAVKNYHRSMIVKGAESLDRFGADERDISSLTMGLSSKTVKKLKSMILDFQREVMHVVDQDEEIEEIVQFNFQLFPLTKKKGAGNEEK
ncbi:MAG: TIGR02147 family protein [bacterium]|nr:TIGR02147 family protein [bacterium]